MTRFSRPEILSRISTIRKVFIETDETRYARDELEDRLDFGGAEDTAEASMLLAESSTGKSALVKSFARSHNKRASHTSDKTQILYVNLPTPCTVKSMTDEILSQLKDPLAHRTTSSKNTRRISGLAKDRGLQLIIIDEIQHLIDPTRKVVLHDAADWLKRTLDVTGVPFVLVGLPSASAIFKIKEDQLSRRTDDVIRLTPFRCQATGKISEEVAEEERKKFRGFLKVYESQLGFEVASNLYEESAAAAIFAATGGIIGRVAQLIRKSARKSMKRADGVDAITWEDLAQAFAGLPVLGPNPFDPGAQDKTEKSLGERYRPSPKMRSKPMETWTSRVKWVDKDPTATQIKEDDE